MYLSLQKEDSMKKIVSFLLSICIGLSLCACSGPNKADVIEFFDAFDKTLDLNSGEFSGDVKYKVGEDTNNMHLSFSLIQTGDVQLSLNLGLEANGNKLEDFINFYIKDGKTYLNYMGTTSQSLAKNIGIDPKKKLSFSNPFLDYTDSELASLFNSVKKEGNKFTMEIKPGNLAKMLDEFGGIQVNSAIVTAVLEKGYISHLTFDLEGSQSFSTDQKEKVSISFNGNLENINSLSKIDFPENLEKY